MNEFEFESEADEADDETTATKAAKRPTTLARLQNYRETLANNIVEAQASLSRLDDVIATAQDKPELLAAYDTVAEVIKHY